MCDFARTVPVSHIILERFLYHHRSLHLYINFTERIHNTILYVAPSINTDYGSGVSLENIEFYSVCIRKIHADHLSLKM